jgi:hypothetical protein
MYILNALKGVLEDFTILMLYFERDCTDGVRLFFEPKCKFTFEVITS